MKSDILILVMVFSFVSAGHAAAYVDLGTGSYIIQVLIGFLFAALIGVKHYWQRIRGWFGSKRNKN